jgi:shikimate kinase
MASPRVYRNIALTGFMGAGKSTVGHLLAELLGFVFLDTDRVIEQRQNRKVSEIFAQDGEPAFRTLESALCTELESVSGHVIATGGGLAVDPANLESLRRHAFVVCLWASPETLYERVRHQSHRPLLQNPDPLARIRELLAVRTPAYREADLLVGVDYRAAIDTARQIAVSFRRAQTEEFRASNSEGSSPQS